MTFDDVVDSLTSLFDVTTTKAAAVTNDRLQDMVTRSTALRAITSLGTTVNGTTSYALAANVAKIFKAWVAYTAGTAVYEGTETIEDLVDLDAGLADVVDTDTAYWVVIAPDADALATTDNFRLYPTPAESAKTITGLVALRPAVLTYGSASALPIPTETHRDLLEGAKAVLYAEEGREDEAAVPDAKYEQGIKELLAGVERRGKGSGSHRIRVVGYDLNR
jgi:hypothetical protein